MIGVSAKLDEELATKAEEQIEREKPHLADMFLDPLESLDLIFEAVIQTSAILDLLASQEPVWTNSVVEGNHDDVRARRFDQPGSIVVCIRIRIEATTLYPKEHREIGRVLWGIHIDEQAIFGFTSAHRVFPSWDTNGAVLSHGLSAWDAQAIGLLHIPCLLLEHPLLAVDPAEQQIATGRQEAQHIACLATVQCRWRAHRLGILCTQDLQLPSGQMQPEAVAEPRRKDCSAAFCGGTADRHKKDKGSKGYSKKWAINPI
jgi:hypothetical protein